MGVLILKIKKEIKNINNEIRKENFKFNYFKRSLYITKIKELNVESKVLQQQYNKISTLIDNSLELKEQNDKAMEEFENLKENINRQEIILSNLDHDCLALEKHEHYLNNQLLTLKNDLKTKIEKAKKIIMN
jgi:seryl-tRNA synthetase